MQAQRVIVVDGFRLMRDLLRRVIEKTPEFEVVREVGTWEGLPALLRQEVFEWLFFVLSPNQELPEPLTTELLMAHPTLRIIVFWTDGSHVKTEWLGRRERDFAGITLSQFTSLLQQELWTDHPNDPDTLKG